MVVDVDDDADVDIRAADGGFFREREAGMRIAIDWDWFGLLTLIDVAPAWVFEEEGEIGRMPAVSLAVRIGFEFPEPKRFAIASANGSTSGGWLLPRAPGAEEKKSIAGVSDREKV